MMGVSDDRAGNPAADAVGDRSAWEERVEAATAAISASNANRPAKEGTRQRFRRYAIAALRSSPDAVGDRPGPVIEQGGPGDPYTYRYVRSDAVQSPGLPADIGVTQAALRLANARFSGVQSPGEDREPDGMGWLRSEQARQAAEAEVTRLRAERDKSVARGDHWEARVGEFEEALREAIEAARDFNRGGMTWREYDALLIRLSALAAAGEPDEDRSSVGAEALERARAIRNPTR